MSTPAPDSSREEVSEKESSELRCGICDKPVEIETAKLDAAGNAVHQECYAFKGASEQASEDGHADAARPWKLVATEICREQDPKKMTELVTELNQALDEQNLDGTPKPRPDGMNRTHSGT